MKVKVKVAGASVGFIYNDKVATAFRRMGKVIPRRASHVEPCPKTGDWYADLSPVDGPKLGPFKTRNEALIAETNWLEDNKWK